MTPTPTAGDIWEWDGHHDPGVFLLLSRKPSVSGDYWIALNLTDGIIGDIAIHRYNAPHWRFLA